MDGWAILAALALFLFVAVAAVAAALLVATRRKAHVLCDVLARLGRGEFDARANLAGDDFVLGELPRSLDSAAEAIGQQLEMQRQLELTLQKALTEVEAKAKRRRQRYARIRGELQDRVAHLRESQARYRKVIGQTADGFFLANADDKRIVEFNPAFRNMLGYGSDEIRQLTVYDFSVTSRNEVDAFIDQALASDEWGFVERHYRRHDQSVFDVEISGSRLIYRGRDVFCGVVHDISARKFAERQLHEQNKLLEQRARSERDALEKLKSAQSQLVQSEKLAGLGQMVAGVAHEINNPLAFVNNNVAVLQRDIKALVQLIGMFQQGQGAIAGASPELAKEIADLAERIDLSYTVSNLDDLLTRSREGLRRIQQIVRDLRDFARLDESDLHEVDLNAGIESTINIVLGRAKRKQVKIECDLHPLPAVACWPAKINQVIMNLLANAIDASSPGGVVKIGTAQEAGGDGVRLEVADQGHGMTAEVRARIFDPFFTTKPQGEGTGLGLSISHGIVTDHGGRIEVESSPGTGA
ncbi:MAG TPA: ATP-binding protein, partial [Tepidisphaeraceae bacterium]|nr:ATP-binding protein [Tepidisphaeraceae bacterium]